MYMYYVITYSEDKKIFKNILKSDKTKSTVNDRSNKCLHVGEKCCFSLHLGVLLQRMVLAFNTV